MNLLEMFLRFFIVFKCFSGGCRRKPGQHQLPDRLQVGPVHPQRELLLPDPAGPQQGQLPGLMSPKGIYLAVVGQKKKS